MHGRAGAGSLQPGLLKRYLCLVAHSSEFCGDLGGEEWSSRARCLASRMNVREAPGLCRITHFHFGAKCGEGEEKKKSKPT